MTAPRGWAPPLTFEERLKHSLVPPALYVRYRVWKELRYGERELRLLPALASPARASVDVGANKGVYSYVLARCSAHVHAFEPNPKMFALLRRTAPANVTVSPLAIGDRSGPAELRVPKSRKGYSNQRATLRRDRGGADAGVVTVECRRLDDLALSDIGFIKIDVEGFELQVLDGARALLARERPNLLVEIEEIHTGRPIEELIAAVEGLGYRGLALHRDGLITLERFDARRHHRRDEHPEDYIFNFVFVPK